MNKSVNELNPASTVSIRQQSTCNTQVTIFIYLYSSGSICCVTEGHVVSKYLQTINYYDKVDNRYIYAI